MVMKKMYLLLAISCLCISSCSKNIDIAHEKKVLGELLKQERKAHFANDVDLFLSEFADTTISVRKGGVRREASSESRKRIESYFNSVEFIHWDDVAPPIIDISEDGSLAYAIVQKNVVLTYKDTLGVPLMDTTNYAWITIYKKLAGEWKMVCNASTEN